MRNRRTGFYMWFGLLAHVGVFRVLTPFSGFNGNLYAQTDKIDSRPILTRNTACCAIWSELSRLGLVLQHIRTQKAAPRTEPERIIEGNAERMPNTKKEQPRRAAPCLMLFCSADFFSNKFLNCALLVCLTVDPCENIRVMCNIEL